MNLRSIFGIVATLFILACDNELSINAEWQDITVVYGILDPTQDTNFIRIERGYLGSEPARNSYDKPDSLYYDENEITVTLYWYEINNGNRGNLVDSSELRPDYNIRNLNSDGPFTTEAYRIYPIISPDIPVSSQYEYELIIDKNDGGPQVTASTRVLEGFDLRRPARLGGIYEYQGLLSWDNESKNKNIYLYQPRFYFYYKEYNLDTKESEMKEIMYRFQNVERKGGITDYEVKFSDNNAFYAALAGRIETDSSVLRFFDHMRFEIWGADENLTTYMNLKAPSNSINQNRPEFTNIVNGTGIFASRIKLVLDDVLLQDAGSPSYEDGLYLRQVLCEKRFARTQKGVGDTCICDDIPNAGINELKCPYDEI
ncbi:MAG TPA: hypothetical protein DDW81_01405 [Cryomorphaceae bacterium]|nr:hypothetical protein [Owenweeksia sp.]HBF18719.1 hypothetical protein [Cryomorphaceae bacterium]HCQ15437.1 hypothetical protein [Cryomorphaceae bacterium]|tara:strand:+ start:1275 stop:2387 length:1113 start_codon:yes stop_codon:yes gene_type:complete